MAGDGGKFSSDCFPFSSEAGSSVISREGEAGDVSGEEIIKASPRNLRGIRSRPGGSLLGSTERLLEALERA